VQYVTSLRRDGATHLLLDPLELIEKLTVLIPPPRFHLLRFPGVLAPRAQLRAAVVPRSSRDAALGGAPAPRLSPPAPQSPPVSGAGRLSWAALMRRVFEIDVLLCRCCGGRRRSVAVYPGGPRLSELLDRLGLSQPPGPIYNGQRRHSALGYLSPRAFERGREHEALAT
jgi:hypothetical protein